jgi:hypothetical protein
MPANYVLLNKVTLAETTASITFSNIPQTGYTDLKVVCSTRYTAGATGSDIQIKLNTLTTNFTYRTLFGSGSAASSGNGTDPVVGLTAGSADTANTFGNTEIYIPNYTSSNFKSISSDSVTENNATLSYMGLYATLWSNTAAITSVTLFNPTPRSFAQYSTFYLYGLAAVGTTPVIAPFASGGDIITNDGTYWIHTFLSSGTFTPAKSLTCQYLVVAGGGGGGNTGGGGAGGYRSSVTGENSGGGASAESAISLTANTAYTTTIGAGGNGQFGSNTNGSNSVFGSITSVGGGKENTLGGSGGGGGNSSGELGGAGTTGQGFAGGRYRGGGGGASAAGQGGAFSPNTGIGGAGVSSSINGSAVTRAGGGGGALSSTTGGAGGAGGGGAGGGAGTSGTANTGGGGGAGWNGNGVGVGMGGSGIVIVRYPMV